jgi:hypothetical protein
MQVRVRPDRERRERPLIEICGSIGAFFAICAEVEISFLAPEAFATSRLDVAKPNTIASELVSVIGFSSVMEGQTV